MRLLKILSGILFLGLLASCGHEPVGRDFEFNASKGYALLGYDITFIGDPFPNFSLYLFPYDPETGAIETGKRVETGCGFLCSRGNEEVRFFLKPINPGTYVVGYVFYTTDFSKTILCYSRQTMEIETSPGTILYLGELTLSMDHPSGLVMDKLKITQHDEAHVRARLAKFPYVLEVDSMYRPDGTLRAVRSQAEPGQIVIAPVELVAFDRGEVNDEGACIRDYRS